MPDTHNTILSAIRSTPGWDALAGALPASGSEFRLTGTTGSSAASVIAALHTLDPERVVLAVVTDPGDARSLEADLTALLGEEVAHLFPQREGLPWDATDPHVETSGLRVEAVEALYSGRGRLFVTTLRGLQERFPVPAQLDTLRIRVVRGETIPLSELVKRLEARGFERVPVVEEIGHFAVRGGLIDLFSVGSPDPLRIEFWGDEIDSIRSFDIVDQRSTGTLDEAVIIPVSFGEERDDTSGTHEARAFVELLPSGTLIVDCETDPWSHTATRTWEAAQRTHADLVDSGMRTPTPVEELFLPADALLRRVEVRLQHLAQAA
ncbi:MAG: hypothetical protein RQ745_08450, partial [Longimicrobiales bacterium]|nr:hypothetical protein [Longimicrobiales bacterium]